mmetsp:Transcript_14244/g.29468  ORF Transcript_14244/g.29468 Transcript_14244/m.29468 type:complete len:93 (+) Transcript_14244:208-486(+)
MFYRTKKNSKKITKKMYSSKQVLFAFLAVLSVATATNQDRGGLGRRLKSSKTAAPSVSSAPSSNPSIEPSANPSLSHAPSKAGKAGKSSRRF